MANGTSKHTRALRLTGSSGKALLTYTQGPSNARSFLQRTSPTAAAGVAGRIFGALKLACLAGEAILALAFTLARLIIQSAVSSPVTQLAICGIVRALDLAAAANEPCVAGARGWPGPDFFVSVKATFPVPHAHRFLLFVVRRTVVLAGITTEPHATVTDRFALHQVALSNGAAWRASDLADRAGLLACRPNKSILAFAECFFAIFLCGACPFAAAAGAFQVTMLANEIVKALANGLLLLGINVATPVELGLNLLKRCFLLEVLHFAALRVFIIIAQHQLEILVREKKARLGKRLIRVVLGIILAGVITECGRHNIRKRIRAQHDFVAVGFLGKK
jgi:hypothetical protein